MTDRSTFEHPMDDFPVRKLRFDFAAHEPETAVWSESSELFSLFANAFTLHVPYFEKYLVRSMMAARPKITDDKLVDHIVELVENKAAEIEAANAEAPLAAAS